MRCVLENEARHALCFFSKKGRPSSCSSVAGICLQTLLHTKNNHAVSRINAEELFSGFSHKSLVSGSSPGGPTRKANPH